MSSMEKIDSWLNNITMYRLVVYALGVLSGLGIIFSFLGHLSVSPTALVVSLCLLLASALAADRGFGRVLNIPSNSESWLITALILFLIIQPANSIGTGLALLLAGAISSLSKFLLAPNGKHLFNPAALAATFMSLWGFLPTTWWIGSSIFWPFSLVLGLAIVRKMRRVPLFVAFVGVSIVLQFVVFVLHHQPLITDMKHALIASPLIFLSTIMLTEPATMPPRRNLQIVFAALVAVLYVMAWKIGPLIIYPEVALLIGNMFAYFVSPKFRVRMQLKEIQRISDQVYNYVFQPDRRFNFLPGQYMEWTLADVPYDSRGNRRTFTIASSPTEEDVQLGLKYYEPASTYKAKFYDLKPGDFVYASQLAGNFTLEGNEKKKLVFIAGGIGITPFRSMVKYLSDKNRTCDIVLLYMASNPDEFAYVREFNEAARVGVRTIPIVTRPGTQMPGVINAKLGPELVTQVVPDYNERIFYISGPNVMVDATKAFLRDLGVPGKHVITDHFSGY